MLLMATTLAALAPPSSAGAQADAADASYSAQWAGGRDYASFYETALGRRSLWVRNTERAAVPAALLARARAAGGTWHLLAVSIDRCSDSVSTLPYLAALADAVPGLTLRIIPPEGPGREIMESHPTPDGRAATPTVLLLDEGFHEVGAFIERPPALQEWYLDREGALSSNELYAGKMEWYDRDAGESTIAAVVELLESAAARRNAR